MSQFDRLFPRRPALIGVVHLPPLPGYESARLAALHRADAIIVTGTVTGEAPEHADLELASSAAADIPVLIGSGLAPHNARTCLAKCRGAVVGSALMSDGRADMDKVQLLRSAMS